MTPELAVTAVALSLAGILSFWILRLYRKLQAMEQYRRDLIVNITHEFLTPLTVIKGYAETLLLDKPDRRQAQSHIEIVQSHADRLMKMVEDLLRLSRLENVNPRERLSLVDLREFCGELYHRFKPRLDARKIAWNFAFKPPLGNIETDPGILEIIFNNLVGNAIKYSEPGGRIEICGEREGLNVRFEVRDRGIGISREDQKRIFERFYRVNKDRARESGGTGLGLSIVKHAVKSLGGEIAVESEPGRGSVFYFTIRA
ncbi:MAG: hypothetical protein HY541_06460 [Deltaproteobacteria bacterium]|nr:hypothetical protein [Deltaproteobacteria bacterium]